MSSRGEHILLTIDSINTKVRYRYLRDEIDTFFAVFLHKVKFLNLLTKSMKTQCCQIVQKAAKFEQNLAHLRGKLPNLATLEVRCSHRHLVLLQLTPYPSPPCFIREWRYSLKSHIFAAMARFLEVLFYFIFKPPYGSRAGLCLHLTTPLAVKCGEKISHTVLLLFTFFRYGSYFVIL